MSGRSSVPGAVEYATELNWGESSSTFGSRLAVLGEVNASGLEQAKIDGARTVQYLQDGSMPIRGVIGGEFTTDIWLPGHGTTTAGAVSLKDHENVLGYAMGNATSTGTGDTATGGTAATPTTTSASGFVAGGIVFVGALGDAGGNGQAGVVSTHSGSSLALLTALPAAPANAAVIASSVVIYATETTASATVQPMRFRLLTADQQYACHGCFAKSIRISGLNPGEIPRASITWGVSWWEEVSATFPSAVSVDTFAPAPCAAGSLHVQAVATATRQTYACRAFEVSIDLGVIPVMGPGGINAFQPIVSAQRGPATVTASFVVDADSVSATPTWPVRWDSDSTRYQLLYGWNGAATGKRGAVYLSNACLTDKRPVQMSDGGLNRIRLTFRAYTGPTTTSEMTLSAFRLAQG